jgi:hypothetical protein
MKSRNIGIDEFNYDSLVAPPINALFTPDDIGMFYELASSIKYSARLEYKYKCIDEVMRCRGFQRLGTGTNRAVYKFLEDTSFVAKVPYATIALEDNLAEFRNQFLLKPFVSKCFETHPSGAVGIFERVNPVTSREQFITIAKDVFTLIDEFLVGEYILADFGTRFFMNYGIREGFGPVLLDYPYVYKLDGNKLFCNKPDPTNKTGRCEGIIDYDPGYNFLYCKKCGAKYKAQELSQKIKTKAIIIKEQGEKTMKITLNGGSRNFNNKVISDNPNYIESAKSIADTTKQIHVETERSYSDENVPVVRIKRSTEVKAEIETPNVIKVSLKPETTTVEEKAKEVVKPVVEPEIKEVVEEAPKKESIAVEEKVNKFLNDYKPSEKLTVNGTEEAPKKDTPVSFDSSLINNNGNMMKKTIEEYNSNKVEEKTYFEEALEFIDKLADNIEELDKDELDQIRSNEKLIAIIKKLYSVNFTVNDVSIDDSQLITAHVTPVLLSADADDEKEPVVYGAFDDIDFDFSIVDTTEDADNEEEVKLPTVKMFNASLINITDILPNANSKKIAVISDEDDNYMKTKDGDILAIDKINGRAIDDSAITDKEYFEKLLSIYEDSMNTVSAQDASVEEEE